MPLNHIFHFSIGLVWVRCFTAVWGDLKHLSTSKNHICYISALKVISVLQLFKIILWFFASDTHHIISASKENEIQKHKSQSPFFSPNYVFFKLITDKTSEYSDSNSSSAVPLLQLCTGEWGVEAENGRRGQEVERKGQEYAVVPLAV